MYNIPRHSMTSPACVISTLLISYIICSQELMSIATTTTSTSSSNVNQFYRDRYVIVSHEHSDGTNHSNHPINIHSITSEDETSFGPLESLTSSSSLPSHSQILPAQAIGPTSGELDNNQENTQSSSISTSWIKDSLSKLFGKVAKGFVYSTATLARLNNRVLCTLLTHESEIDNEDQPTLYAFNDLQSPERAFRIYADDQITQEMLDEAQFDPTQMTIFLVHGWLGGIHNELWLSQAKDVARRFVVEAKRRKLAALRKHRHSPAGSADLVAEREQEPQFQPNVIIVDWSDLSLGSLYTATQNSIKVSSRLARLFRQLAQVGKLQPQLMHCLGHSIGTHICGRAAREAFPQPASVDVSQMQKWEKFGRITGLDPGGFCYELDIRSEGVFEGLRPSDALLTDAYYTNRSPFGNKYQVAQFNVHVNDAFLQRACSVWRRPEVAREYFLASIRYLMGTTSHNDILTCDHYFATKLAGLSFEEDNQDGHDRATSARMASVQAAEQFCSNLAYSCSSYGDFLRGRCGTCRRNSPGDCYPMDFEYQRVKPSIQHAWNQLQRYSNYSRQPDEIDRPVVGGGPPGAVAYSRRGVYYVRSFNGTECSRLFRLRVQLTSGSERNALLAKLLDLDGEPMALMDPLRNRLRKSIRLHGPWSLWKPGVTPTNLDSSQEENLDPEAAPNWKTALIEVPRDQLLDEFFKQIGQIGLEPARNATIRTSVGAIQLDYLSSTSRKLRLKYSRNFQLNEQVLLASDTSKQEEWN